MNKEIDLVTSHLSGTVDRDGTRVWLEIYRLEAETEWTLEVINEAGASIIWGNRFVSPDAAYATFRAALDENGIDAFQDERKGIAFPKR